ncbi:MAG: AAA family ATPase [Planctomycetes bacterium]|nr:AAA family ATPase [Planctomycetota bacterium]
MFTRFEFRDFRGFAHLDLQGLQRVNLICGQNNSGKTSLLEGIEVLCDYSRWGAQAGWQSLRPDPDALTERKSRWWIRDGSPGLSSLSGYMDGGQGLREVYFVRNESGLTLPRGVGAGGGTSQVSVGVGSFPAVIPCRTVSAQQRSTGEVIGLFDKAVSRRGGEEHIEALLRLVDPRVRKVRARTPAGEAPFLEVDLGLSERIPLAHTGQGLTRLVAIFSMLLGESPKVCVIDEIENGLHHTLLPQIWAGIAAAAREFDVQVFATTHSRECIEAAHEVFAGRSSYDFSVIQLFRSDNDRDLPVQGRVLDQRLVSAAMSGSVELR